jgi:hypothetical protein
MVVHWLSGNVPLLGLYSIFQAMMTKNVSLVKASSRAYRQVVLLLEDMSNVSTSNLSGSDMAKTVSVILVDRDDIKTAESMSVAADVRIAWGGHEAVSTILSLKKGIFCEDIIYGPKYSYGIVDNDSIKDYKQIAKRLAFDICTFDQYACSSPHTIFVQADKELVYACAEELGKNIDFITRKMMPKDEDPQKKLDILTVRAKNKMMGNRVFASENTDWTVVVSEGGLENACFSRVVFIKPIKDVEDVGMYNDSGKQTIGAGLSGPDRERIAERITIKGANRITRFGEMTLFETPWDGFFGIDRMVRWVSLYNDKN